MTVSTQSRKHAIGLAGEFLVAGELLRRGIMAAVTYGNAKKADVVAVNGTRAAQIEVKTTSAAKWVLGGDLPEDSAKVWILVFLPPDETLPPEFFVLTSAELRKCVLPRHDAYMERYRREHGKEYSAKGVVSVQRKEIDDKHLGAWHKVASAVDLQRSTC